MLFSQDTFINFAAALYKFHIRSAQLSGNTLVSKKEIELLFLFREKIPGSRERKSGT